MTELQRLQQMFAELYDGKPWLGVTFKNALKGLDAQSAAKHSLEGRHSCWEILHHIIFWRLNVMRKLPINEQIRQNPVKDFQPPISIDDTSWQGTLKIFREVHEELLALLQKLDAKHLNMVVEKTGQPYFWYLHGLLQHDAYHLGQLAMLRKAVLHE